MTAWNIQPPTIADLLAGVVGTGKPPERLLRRVRAEAQDPERIVTIVDPKRDPWEE